MSETPTIWKFPLPLDDVAEVELPGSHAVLSAGLDPAGDLAVWAYVYPGTPVVTRRFAIVGTGHPAAHVHQSQHLASVTSGPFVWHVFDLGVTR